MTSFLGLMKTFRQVCIRSDLILISPEKSDMGKSWGILHLTRPGQVYPRQDPRTGLLQTRPIYMSATDQTLGQVCLWYIDVFKTWAFILLTMLYCSFSPSITELILSFMTLDLFTYHWQNKLLFFLFYILIYITKWQNMFYLLIEIVMKHLKDCRKEMFWWIKLCIQERKYSILMMIFAKRLYRGNKKFYPYHVFLCRERLSGWFL